MPNEIRYRMADGSLVCGEFTYVSELEFFDDDDEVVELTQEEIVVVSSVTVQYRPRSSVLLCSVCDGDGEDEDGIECAHCRGDGSEPDWPLNPRVSEREQ